MSKCLEEIKKSEKGFKKCSFCDKLKPIEEIRLTQDKKDYVCKYLKECEVLE